MVLLRLVRSLLVVDQKVLPCRFIRFINATVGEEAVGMLLWSANVSAPAAAPSMNYGRIFPVLNIEFRLRPSSCVQLRGRFTRGYGEAHVLARGLAITGQRARVYWSAVLQQR